MILYNVRKKRVYYNSCIFCTTRSAHLFHANNTIRVKVKQAQKRDDNC